MKKRILSFILAVCLVFGLCATLKTGASAYSTDYPNTYVNTGNQRTDVVQIAQTQVGYTYDEGTKYGAWWSTVIGSDFSTMPWCAMFLTWCLNQAGSTTAYFSSSALCSSWLSNLKSGQNGNAAYAFGSGYVPRPGDLIFVGYKNGTTDHVGLVTAVDATTIYTVEGNYSSKVSNVTYDRSTGIRSGGWRVILYYGVPSYTNDTTTADFSDPVTTPTGSDSDAQVVSYDVKITASLLNVRANASTSSSAQYTLSQGTVVSIVAEITGSNGQTWGQLSTGGWICLTGYAEKVTASDGSDPEPNDGGTVTAYDVTVSCDILTVRSGAGTSNAQTGTLHTGDTVTIVDKTTSGGLEWGQLSTGGWIALKYTAEAAQTPDSGSTDPGFTSYEVKITASLLNVRATPDTGAVTGTLSSGATATVTAEQTVSGRTWGQLSTGGWICLEYASKVTADTGTTTDPVETPSTGTTVTVTGTVVNVRSGAGTSNGVVSTLTKGASCIITQTVSADGATWGELSSGGWICLTYTTYSGDAATSTPTETTPTTGTATSQSGTVTASVLNVRSTPGTGSVVSYLYKGNTVEITELTTADGASWGKTSAGWISMAYVSTSSGGGSTTGSSGRTATITGSVVNVRSGPGTGNSILSSLTKGASCVIVAEQSVDGRSWGQLSSGGWICLDYAS
ncbi:MAG: CHAP domain-containing protein [Oscillospiraceae bacterium]|nr:CHAP domain-containing protein [Oscillospiraceae bacterium]